MAKTKKQCQELVSKKIRKLRKEGVSQKVAVARGLAFVRRKNKDCRKFIKKNR